MVYNLNNLSEMLIEMGEYLQDNQNQGYEDDFKGELFALLAQSGLFHDACGEIISSKENEVTVTTDY